MSKSCQKVVKSSQKIVKKLSESCQNCQKAAENHVTFCHGKVLEKLFLQQIPIQTNAIFPKYLSHFLRLTEGKYWHPRRKSSVSKTDTFFTNVTYCHVFYYIKKR
jgi:hypothetical protein